MAETIISKDDIAAKRIELGRTHERSLDSISRKADSLSYGNPLPGKCYDSWLHALSTRAAVDSRLSQSSQFSTKPDRAKASTLFSSFASASIALENLVQEQEDESKTMESFSRRNLDFNTPRELVQNMIDVYDNIMMRCFEDSSKNIENLTAQYFQWVKEQSLKHSGENVCADLDSYLRKNPLIIQTRQGDKKFNAFGIQRIEDNCRYSWELIGGYDAIKEECKDISIAIKNIEILKRRHENPLPTGILLYGPPGTGKTTLAKTIAHEAGVPFEEIKSSSSIASSYKDGSVEKLNSILARTKRYVSSGNHDAAILIIDELDSLAGTRGDHREDDKVVNTLLCSMDSRSNPGMIYIGCTNRPDIIDSSLKRPGRFTKMIYVGNPNTNDREKIFKTILENRREYAAERGEKTFSSEIDFKKLGNNTDGFSCDDVREIVDSMLWKQSMDHIKNRTQIIPITTDMMIERIESYKEQRKYHDETQRSYV